MKCEAGHECHLLNKTKTEHKSHGLQIYEYTYTKKYTCSLKDVTAFIGALKCLKCQKFKKYIILFQEDIFSMNTQFLPHKISFSL
jgi:hypothetical protein